MLTQAAQIFKLEAAFVGVGAFSSAGGTSETFTSTLTTVLSTAGNGAVPVPLQAGSLTAEGVSVAPAFNRCRIFATGTQKPLQDANGNDVYGRITVSGSTWTLGYFVAPGGTEAAFTMPANTVIDISVPYIFSFDHKPYYAGIGELERHVAPDGALFNWREFSEALTVTATNTLSALTNTPDGRKVLLYVNHLVYTLNDADAPFTVSNKQITWSANNAGFSLQTSFVVTAVYTY